MKYTEGLVLSGGGVRGFAHLGVLKALNEVGIFPEAISGVSAGAIMGALYADGYTPDDIFKMLSELEFFKLLKFKRPRLGLLNSDGLKKYLGSALRAKEFSDLSIPLTIAATNLNKAKLEYFESGNLIDAIMASSAFPFIIRPYPIGEELYIDGGLMNNLPVQPLLGHCDRIIGVYVNPVREESQRFRPRLFADRLMHIGLRANILPNIPNCHFFIEPPELYRFNLFRTSAAKEIFEIGYFYAKNYLTQQGL